MTRAFRAGGAGRQTWPQCAGLRLNSLQRSFFVLSQICFHGPCGACSVRSRRYLATAAQHCQSGHSHGRSGMYHQHYRGLQPLLSHHRHPRNLLLRPQIPDVPRTLFGQADLVVGFANKDKEHGVGRTRCQLVRWFTCCSFVGHRMDKGTTGKAHPSRSLFT